MKIVEQSFEFVEIPNGDEMLKKITKIGYVSHNTKKEVDAETAKKFVKRHCIDSKPEHGTLLEFGSICVKIVTDRAIANELVRHRIATYNQRSSRYVFEKDLEVVAPLGLLKNNPLAYHDWYKACCDSETKYMSMRNHGAKAEDCRDVLPLSTATEIVANLNLRSWRNFFYLRAEEHAHPKMIALANMMLREFKNRVPIVFDDLEVCE